MNRYINIAIGIIIILLSYSCTKTESSNPEDAKSSIIRTRAVTPDAFEWDTSDWMPTPSGQPKIPMPWGGQGSISDFYGLDIVNDYHRKDGWRMVYSTFRDYGEELVDPYFVLYNVYRGTLRIYFFITSPYIGTSTYLQDVLYLNNTTGATSNILNYLDGSVVNIKKNISKYDQIQPKTLNGAAPLTGRRWYMMEYEMAYDPNLSKLSSSQITMSWGLNYYNIDKITIDGKSQGEIYGTIGGPDNFLNDAKNTACEGALSIVGLGTLEKLSINDKTGDNKIGLPKEAFKSIVSGIKGALSSASGGLPGMAIGFMNSVFGGNSESSTKVVSLRSKTSINLSGTFSSHGSVSSTPIDFKIPGTIIPHNSTGYVPLYNEPLGIIYWKGGAIVNIDETISTTMEPDEINGSGEYRVVHHRASDRQQDYSKYVIINPSVEEIANVSILSQTVYAVTTDDIGQSLIEFPLVGTIYDNPWESDAPLPEVEGVCIKLLIEVKPNDGTPVTYITKTFYADDYTWSVKHIN